MFPITRLRRLRETGPIRRLVQETHLDPAQMIWPCFVVPGQNVQVPIESMPGQFHFSKDKLAIEIKEIVKQGVGGILLFGVPDKKDPTASEATQKNSLVSETIKTIKEANPECLIVTDVCLCAYTDHGHCGLIDTHGKILNDPSLEILAEMSLRHAEAGADILAPSDMMDGRIKAIRSVLDKNGFDTTPILSYAAKYASAFYGPFRDAAHSKPSFGDRKSYQMNPANAREALREMEADLEEGADMLMVKPALPYLDVISAARKRFHVPLAAYQVSGEYTMIKLAAQKGLLDEKEAMLESLTAIKRAGADIIISYFARQFAHV